jgi:hypothetical protein
LSFVDPDADAESGDETAFATCVGLIPTMLIGSTEYGACL